MSNRISISPKKASEVFCKTNGVCYYCNTILPDDTIYVDWGGKEVMRKRNWEVDHVVPVCKGGDNKIENLVPACMGCNRKKGAK